MNPSHVLSTRARIVCAGLFLALAWTSPAFTAPDQRGDAETLTRSLVGLNTAYQKAAPKARLQALEKIVDTARERHALLAELIKVDPDAVLRTAIPARIRNRMPAEVQSFIEQHLELDGELEVIYEDYGDGSHHQRHTITAHGEQISLHFKSPPPGLLSGTPIQVSGVLVDNAMAVESGEDDILILALNGGVDGGSNGGAPALIANTIGEQRTLVILVNFQDNPDEPYTPDFARDVILGETSDFFFENSYGQTWLSGDVTDWYTIPVNSTVCDGPGIRLYGEQAASNAGFDLTSYDRLVIAYPQNACGFWGSSTVGGAPSRVQLNGDLELALTGHELGHSLGLYHAQSLNCDDGSVVGPGSASFELSPWPNCSGLEYGDGLDIMGWSPSGHFSAFQKERLGWLGYGNSPAIVQIETSGSYELSPYATSNDGNPKALKIQKAVDANGIKTWYYLEYRQAVGFDSYLDSNLNSMDAHNVLNGVTVHVQYGNGGSILYLLDMTPETDVYLYQRDPALLAGKTFVDPEGIMTITTDWTDAAGAIVSVSLAQPDCVTANPTIALSPSESEWIAPGTPVIYTATLTNHDNTLCAAATFDFAASIPDGWTADFADLSLALEPGTSDTTTVTVTSSITAGDNFYDVVVSAANASDPAYTATSSVTYVVSNPPTNQAPIAIDDSAETTQDTAVVVDVLNNDSDPDGDPLTLASVTQGANGAVTINPDGSVTHTPNHGFAGKSSFTYTVSDGHGGSANATVIVTVIANPSNQAPVALDDPVTIQEEAPVTIDVSANDSDPDGDQLSIASVTQGTRGAVTVNVDGTLTYTPAKSFKDGDSFSYTITDGASSATATVTITLQGGGKGRKP